MKPPAKDGWTIDVLKTIGSQSKGIEELLNEIIKHKQHLKESGFLEVKRKEHLLKKIMDLVNNKLKVNFWDDLNKNNLNQRLDLIMKRQDDPYSFVESIVQ